MTGLEIAAQIFKMYPKEFNVEKFNRLLVSDKIFTAFKQGSEAKALKQIWESDLEKFKAVRQKYLLYWCVEGFTRFENKIDKMLERNIPYSCYSCNNS